MTVPIPSSPLLVKYLVMKLNLVVAFDRTKKAVHIRFQNAYFASHFRLFWCLNDIALFFKRCQLRQILFHFQKFIFL